MSSTRACHPRTTVLGWALAGLLLACGGAEEPPVGATAAELISWASGRVDRGDLARGTAAYRMALQRDSLNVDALAGLARVYQLQNRTTPADTYRRRAFHLAYSGGLDLLASRQLESARAQFEAAARIMPDHPLAHLRLGDVLVEAGQPDSAVVEYERAVALNPGFSEARTSLAKAYLAAGRLLEARGAFEKAIESNINDLGAYVGLGQLLAGQGEWAAAASQFSKALLIDPRSDIARQGLESARAGLR